MLGGLLYGISGQADDGPRNRLCLKVHRAIGKKASFYNGVTCCEKRFEFDKHRDFGHSFRPLLKPLDRSGVIHQNNTPDSVFL